MQRSTTRGLVGIVLVACAGVWAPLPAPAAERAIDFNRDVRPILSNKCFACHGPDAAERQGGIDGLRLDTADGAIADLGDGGVAVAAGDPDRSRLLQRVSDPDPDRRMPPASFGKPLTDAEIATLRDWIAQGARYATHWAWVVPQRPEVPEVRNREWGRNSIDRFLLARLEAEGLTPSPPVERTALIRRVTLDLTGLPPTLDEVDAFLADDAPGAYERLVDRLLASEAYGEHLARMWLDLARYGDSAGYADDPARTIWGYRDWVIRAFNRNLPFDQFTIEQLAGDLLPEPQLDQRVATAFHRNTLTNNEGGTDDEEFRNVAVVDRVNTTMAVWMGTTMACAQCHTHKYDPLTQAEYFRFFAYFNNTEDADRRDEAPVVEIVTDEQRRQKADWEAAVKRLEAVTSTPTPELLAARGEWLDRFARPLEWSSPRPTVHSQEGRTAAIDDAAVVALEGPAARDVVTVSLPAAEADRTITALRIEALPAGRNFVVTRVAASLVPAGSTSLAGRYVRVELPGKGQMLSLAEVQVYRGADNIAPQGRATQSSTDYGGTAERAIDGNTNGDYHAAQSTTHTAVSNDPWWELDLQEIRPLDRLVLWNRTDNGLHARLRKFVVKVLDGDRSTVWEQAVAEPPNPSVEFPLSGIRGVTFAAAVADFSQQGFNPADVLAAAGDPAKGWAVAPQQDRPHQLTLTPAAPLTVPAGWRLEVRIEQLSKYDQHTLGRLRVSETGDPRAAEQASFPADVVPLLSRPTGERSTGDDARLTEFFLTIAPQLAAERKELAALRQRITDQKPYTTVPVLRELPPEKRRTTRVQHRGNFLDLGESVDVGLPAMFSDPAQPPPADRLALAHWLVSRDNPLTARVTVNRFWEKIFGVGLVRTVEEFGSQGELPSHPELLDWLAVEFIDSGWDVQGLLRLLVTSAAYQQSSRVTPELMARDPENRLLARGPRFRLTAEMVRDQSLAVAGLLSPKMYGPPVRPPQPSMGLNAAFGSSTDWEPSQGEDRYRRALYVQWRRSNPYPSMSAFDAPNREVCTLKRDRTNTPLQALVTLNDPVYVEAAQALARRMAERSGTIAEKLAYGFRRCLSRPPEPSELQHLAALFEKSRAMLAEQPTEAEKLASDPLGPVPAGSDPIELAAWTVVSNVLLNLDEMLMKR